MKNITYLLILFFFSLTNIHATIQRVRIDFTGPDGYTRHLLLGFTTDNAASDGYDYGYDALNFDNFPNDLNWMIEDDRYVIQGVGAFETTKVYRLGMFLSDSGNIQISLQALENFDQEIPVYVYDSLTGSFTPINNFNFELNILQGNYTERFYLTFSNSIDLLLESNSMFLSIDEVNTNSVQIVFYNNLNQLVVKSNNGDLFIKEIELYSLDGKQVFYKKVNSNRATLETHLPSGIYIVNSTTSNSLKTSKIISI